MKKIFVIEDEQDFASVIVDVAETMGLGAQVLSRRADLELLEKAEQPDVVTLDLNMPEFDGIEVIRILGVTRYSGALVLISGFDSRLLQSASTLAKAHGLKVCGMLTKPCALEELESAFERAIKAAAEPARSGVCEFSEPDVQEALDREQLVPYFQPKIDMWERRIKGVEALVRWHHPELGVLGPGRFLPAVKSADLIDAISMRMLHLSLFAHKAWKAAGMDIPVAVNFEAPSFRSLDLPDRLQHLLESEHVDNDAVVIEVTERSVVGDLVKSLDVLARIRMRGVALSIDDFGTGHSTFEQLQNVPFNQLKIDQRFTAEIAEDGNAKAIVRSMIELADRLGLSCVAEGVETQAQFDMLKAFGCKQVQGYLIAHPMPQAEATNWNQAYLSRAA